MPSTDEIYLLSSDIRILRDLLGGFIKKLLGILLASVIALQSTSLGFAQVSTQDVEESETHVTSTLVTEESVETTTPDLTTELELIEETTETSETSLK